MGGKCGRESERMRRARGARIIGQAQAEAHSELGGPQQQFNFCADSFPLYSGGL